MGMGYMANPSFGQAHLNELEKKTREAIDDEGWLHSGDKGTIGVDGFLRITGRYKELIIGAGGENIAPVPIEDEIKRLCPYVSNAMMVGNKRKFNVVLLTLKAVGATGELPGGDELDGAAAKLSDANFISDAVKDDVFIQTITKTLTAINNDENVVPMNAAKIQKFTILPRDFSVLTNELTATLKLKRSVVDEKYTAIIDCMYGGIKDVYVPYSNGPSPEQTEYMKSEPTFKAPTGGDRQLSATGMQLNKEELQLEAEAAAEEAT